MLDFQAKSIEELSADLCQHTRNSMLFRVNQFTQYNGIVIKDDWSGMNRRRIDFFNCTFEHCDLMQAGFAGSTFTNCRFNGCSARGANFSQCIFSNCSFIGDIDTADFSKCKFVDSSFASSTLTDTNFAEAYLHAVSFTDCKFISTNWEFCEFNKAEFRNSSFSKLNFEYAIFGDIHFINTLVPFQSIPFIFGGPQYVLTTRDNARFKSAQCEQLTLSEYRYYMKEMLEFYRRTDNAFPTANLLLAYGFVDEGYRTIKDGIVQITELRKYRTLKYLTHLFNITTAIPANRKSHLYLDLFDTLTNVNNDLNIDDFDKRTYFNYIRNTLLPTDNGGCICSFKTNIDSTEIPKMEALYRVLEAVTDCLENPSHSVHISHNSAIVMELLIVAVPAIITAAAQIVSTVIAKTKDKDNVCPNININVSGINISADKLQNLINTVTTATNLGIDVEPLLTIIPPGNTNNGSSESHDTDSEEKH